MLFEKPQNKTKLTLFCVFGVFFMRLATLFSFIPLASLFFPNLSHEENVLLLAVYPFAQTLGQIPLGMMGDYFGPKRILLIGSYFFLGVLGVAYCFQDSYRIFLVSRGLQGLLALGAPAQLWLNYQAQNDKELYSRYYLIGLGVVGGIFGGLCFAALAQAQANPGLIFPILLSIQLLLIVSLHYADSDSPLSSKSVPVKNLRSYFTDLIFVFRDLKVCLLFLANIFLHIVQTFVLGGSVFWPTALIANRSFWMLTLFFLSLLLSARALRKRDLCLSLLLCLQIIGIFLMLHMIFLVYDRNFLWILSLLLAVFVLLLLLEAGLGVGLKILGYQQGTYIGLYNTFQYGAMTIGSLLLDRVENFETYQLFCVVLFMLLFPILWALRSHLVGFKEAVHDL